MTTVRRTRHGRRGLCVETSYRDGWLVRGWIRPAGVADTAGPGLAGHLIWQLTDYDHTDLEPITGDYLTAEEALLAATKVLDD